MYLEKQEFEGLLRDLLRALKAEHPEKSKIPQRALLFLDENFPGDPELPIHLTDALLELIFSID